MHLVTFYPSKFCYSSFKFWKRLHRSLFLGFDGFFFQDFFTDLSVEFWKSENPETFQFFSRSLGLCHCHDSSFLLQFLSQQASFLDVCGELLNDSVLAILFLNLKNNNILEFPSRINFWSELWNTTARCSEDRCPRSNNPGQHCSK